MWWMVVAAHAAEPDVDSRSVAPEGTLMARRFVTDPEAIWRVEVEARSARVAAVDEVSVTDLPGGHRTETVLTLAGGRLVDGTWRLGGGPAHFLLDGIALSSDLE